MAWSVQSAQIGGYSSLSTTSISKGVVEIFLFDSPSCSHNMYLWFYISRFAWTFFLTKYWLPWAVDYSFSKRVLFVFFWPISAKIIDHFKRFWLIMGHPGFHWLKNAFWPQIQLFCFNEIWKNAIIEIGLVTYQSITMRKIPSLMALKELWWRQHFPSDQI